jgi:hypothetical protein
MADVGSVEMTTSAVAGVIVIVPASAAAQDSIFAMVEEFMVSPNGVGRVAEILAGVDGLNDVLTLAGDDRDGLFRGSRRKDSSR